MRQTLRISLFNLSLVVGFVAAAAPAQAQISTVIVGTPKAILISGEQVQLKATDRDPQGNPRTGDVFTFTSSNPAVVSVDSSGVATARSLGVANITARAGNVTSPAVALQVLPSRLEVTAQRNEILVGETLQMGAVAFDVNGGPIPIPTQGLIFRWAVTGANGGQINAASIDSSGLLQGIGRGLMTVRAQIEYNTGTSGAHLFRFEALTHVTVNPQTDFKLTRVLTNTALEGPFRLRPGYNSEFAVNERGQIAFTGNLDGQSSALLLYENGRFDVLASAGSPGMSGGYVWHFEGPPAINNRGEVLARIGTMRGWGLIVASREGRRFILEGGSEGAFERMEFFRAGRHSINDRGDVLFLADFRFTGSTVTRTGLFLESEGSVRSIWTTFSPLPSFPASFAFDGSMFGIDRDGNVFFRVTGGASSAIYRTDGISVPVKLTGTGVTTPIGSIQDAIALTLSPSGTMAYSLRFTDGSVGLGRWRAGNMSYLALRSIGQVLSAADTGDVLYSGDPGTGWQVQKWDGQNNTVMIDTIVPLETGDRVGWVKTGKITSSGEVFISADSVDTNVLVVRAGASPRVLWKGGTTLNVKSNFNFSGPVPGSMTGPVHLFTGGGNASIQEVSSDGGTRTVWAPGDRPLSGFTQYVMGNSVRNPNGVLYVSVGDGILQFPGGRAETALRFPIEARTGSEAFIIRGTSGWHEGNNAFAVNSTGAMVFNARTDTQNRLILSKDGQLTSIMTQGGPNATPSPSGGTFASILYAYGRQSTVALDDRGRTLVFADVNGGRSGLFVYEEGRWTATALVGETRIDGYMLTRVRTIKSSNFDFYALMDLTIGPTIAHLTPQGWVPVVRYGDLLPDGTVLTGMDNAFAVNRRGDIVFTAYANIQKIILRTADGVYHIVYTEMTITDDDDRLLSQTYEFDLRDDRRVFFVGMDSLDRNMLYHAEPTF